MHIAAMRNNKDDYDKCNFNKTHNHYPPPKRKKLDPGSLPYGGGTIPLPPLKKEEWTTLEHWNTQA